MIFAHGGFAIVVVARRGDHIEKKITKQLKKMDPLDAYNLSKTKSHEVRLGGIKIPYEEISIASKFAAL